MGKSHVPDWLLERLALGELPDHEANRVREALEKEPGGLLRLEALEASNREILAKHPPARVAASIRARAESGNNRATGWKVLAVALPALLAGTFLLVDRGTVPSPNEDVEITRLKGQKPQLTIHRMGAKGPEPLRPGDEVQESDWLQLSYRAAGQRYGVIVSLDGNRTVTRHLPLRGDEAVSLQQGGNVSLSSSYQLDDAPDFERFFLITSDEPFHVDMVVKAAEALSLRSSSALDDLPLPPSLDQRSFLLRKVGGLP